MKLAKPTSHKITLNLAPLSKAAAGIAHHSTFALAFKILAGLELVKLRESYEPHAGRRAKDSDAPTWAELVHQATGKSEDTAARWEDMARSLDAAHGGKFLKLAGGRDSKRLVALLKEATANHTDGSLKRELGLILPEPAPLALPVPKEEAAPKQEDAPTDDAAEPDDPADHTAAIVEKYQSLFAELEASKTAEEYRALPDPHLSAVIDTLTDLAAELRKEAEARKSRFPLRHYISTQYSSNTYVARIHSPSGAATFKVTCTMGHESAARAVALKYYGESELEPMEKEHADRCRSLMNGTEPREFWWFTAKKGGAQ